MINGNSIVLFDDEGNEFPAPHIKGIVIKWDRDSRNNKILIHKDNVNVFQNCFFDMHCDNAFIKFDKTDFINNFVLTCIGGNNQKLEWGRGSTVVDCIVNLYEQDSALIVGKDCMFSNCINIWCADGHSIIDKNGELLNFVKKPVIIEDHCWIGQGARLLKNAKIPKNSIVGGGAVVAQSFDEPNIVLAGNPAKIVKRDINWDRKNPRFYSSVNFEQEKCSI